ncbi:MAG: DUF3343 domain-containing protein [Bacillota bacterium]
MRICIVFPNPHNAIKLDAILSDERIPHSLIPTPRWISEACGVAIALEDEYRERALDLATRGEVQVAGVFPVEPPANTPGCSGGEC